ncbi:hypothetical protein JQ604_24215 [Bradyrhizobium jicamae]|uniref:hypothetical protein n=1 Tax=Bradyrhizobium jicamae TaxID=280332 RepID=UPI001BAD8FFD|nr:hypothetical protein [Bradyrhizobium jicamae]MBR0755301.1 hypothetical protein [Bradyrhizobium jicamae]
MIVLYCYWADLGQPNGSNTTHKNDQLLAYPRLKSASCSDNKQAGAIQAVASSNMIPKTDLPPRRRSLLDRRVATLFGQDQQ